MEAGQIQEALKESARIKGGDTEYTLLNISSSISITLLDEVRLSEGHVLGDALWVYLIGRSPPVRRTCIRGCPVGIPYWTESTRPKDMY